MGFNIADYPVTFNNYSREISLPIFYNLSDEMSDRVINAVVSSVEAVLNAQ
jgi:dTDP-4-amino-4,6-dideoxygalactose transaminase